jgi:hypothetical protein
VILGDHDDLWLPHRVEHQVRLLRAHEVDMVAGDGLLIDESGARCRGPCARSSRSRDRGCRARRPIACASPCDARSQPVVPARYDRVHSPRQPSPRDGCTTAGGA